MLKILSPLKSIRKYCVYNCCIGQPNEVRLCTCNIGADPCSLYDLRFGIGRRGIRNLKQIRLKCLDCSAGSSQEVRNCEFKDCELYQFRFGKNPNLKGTRGRSAEFMKFMSKMRESKKVVQQNA